MGVATALLNERGVPSLHAGMQSAAVPGGGARMRRNETLLQKLKTAPRLRDELRSQSLSTSPSLKGHGQ